MNPKENLLTVQKQDGRQVSYDPSRLRGIAAYREIAREFAIGVCSPWMGGEVLHHDMNTNVWDSAKRTDCSQSKEAIRLVVWLQRSMRAWMLVGRSLYGAATERPPVHLLRIVPTEEMRIVLVEKSGITTDRSVCSIVTNQNSSIRVHKQTCSYVPITACKQDGELVRNLTNEIKINRNVILSLPEHEARVLETSLDIRNDEVRSCRCLRS
jgi:hypothetical protein